MGLCRMERGVAADEACPILHADDADHLTTGSSACRIRDTGQLEHEIRELIGGQAVGCQLDRAR